MNLEWKPDTAVAVLLFFDRLVSILSAAPHQPLLLSHGFIDPFHDPQNADPTPSTAHSWSVSGEQLLALYSQLSNQPT